MCYYCRGWIYRMMAEPHHIVVDCYLVEQGVMVAAQELAYSPPR